MELPQPRPFGTEGGRKATHDFLSLSSSTTPHQQDQQPSPPGGYLKTQDFLQPLERVGKNVTKDENNIGITASEKPPSPHIPPSVEHLLPGGIGTYSISYFNQRKLKPEESLFAAQTSNTIRIDEQSNGSSYTGSGFTLWNESAAKKGKTGKENVAAERHIRQDAAMTVVGGQWPSMLEHTSQTTSNHKQKMPTFSSFSSSQPSSSQKNQSFMDMITSVKHDNEEDDEDEEEEFTVKRESSAHPKGNLSVKVEAKTMDHKPSTPRSKHSATEQRRRSKINDRFQKLREIIPNSDQKRDKASFLLEVIEYVQFLQEKVNKYESSYSIWNHEPSKMMQQRNCRIEDGFMDHSRGMNESSPAPLFAANFDENKSRGVSPAIPINGQHLIESDTSLASKGRGPQPESTSKPAPIHPTKQPNLFKFGRESTAASPVSPISPKEASDMDKTAMWAPSNFLQNHSCMVDYISPNDKLKNTELSIESGTINISSIYSQGLLDTLTQALQSSGVDLTQASISVQIDLGKRANGVLNCSASTVKQNDVTGVLPRSRVASTEEIDQTLKRPRTS